MVLVYLRERKGKERKGKERKGKERKGKEYFVHNFIPEYKLCQFRTHKNPSFLANLKAKKNRIDMSHPCNRGTLGNPAFPFILLILMGSATFRPRLAVEFGFCGQCTLFLYALSITLFH